MVLLTAIWTDVCTTACACTGHKHFPWDQSYQKRSGKTGTMSNEIEWSEGCEVGSRSSGGQDLEQERGLLLPLERVRVPVHSFCSGFGTSELLDELVEKWEKPSLEFKAGGGYQTVLALEEEFMGVHFRGQSFETVSACISPSLFFTARSCLPVMHPPIFLLTCSPTGLIHLANDKFTEKSL